MDELEALKLQKRIPEVSNSIVGLLVTFQAKPPGHVVSPDEKIVRQSANGRHYARCSITCRVVHAGK